MSTDTHLDAWIDTVETHCGPVRRCLATALAHAADPVTATVRVDHDSYLGGLRRHAAIPSYAGFRLALDRLTRDGVLDFTDDPDVYRLTLPALAPIALPDAS